MQELNLFRIFTEKFNILNIPYAITGSVASIIYGEPRITHDIDIILILTEVNIQNLIDAFPSNDFYIPPLEVINNEIHRETRGHCNIIHNKTAFKADVYFAGNDQLQNWAIKNAKEISFADSKIMIAPPEYVIVKKLEFYKEGKAQKHINDIKAIITNSKDLINFKTLNSFLSKYNLEKEWKNVNLAK